jgi:hypothetical protein
MWKVPAERSVEPEELAKVNTRSASVYMGVLKAPLDIGKVNVLSAASIEPGPVKGIESADRK